MIDFNLGILFGVASLAVGFMNLLVFYDMGYKKNLVVGLLCCVAGVLSMT